MSRALPRTAGTSKRSSRRSEERPSCASSSPRPTATAIHYVLGPGEESVWHRVRSDELWFWHRGAALTLWLGGDGDAPVDPGTAHVLGSGAVDGERPALLVPGGHWQRAAPASRAGGPDGGAVLVSCVVSPGFDYADFTTADPTAAGPTG